MCFFKTAGSERHSSLTSPGTFRFVSCKRKDARGRFTETVNGVGVFGLNDVKLPC